MDYLNTTFTDPGTCFVCDKYPGEDAMDCEGYPRYEGSSKCIVTTAHTLLSLSRIEDTDSVNCLGWWLVKIMRFDYDLLTEVSNGEGNGC